ncbi:TolC family protein [Fulvimonas sp. R45]|uniref:TolC family protein n=1 Tax=Fulvimonas sp. R45 TaxID=3045937 RepID=UPI00265DB794|nr:TolC family protein [Fulvimonas sp. R45]MDO1528754.1 TolC family protein [Fulvimonas sp. R45]
MSAFRSVPLGAVCLLFAAACAATPQFEGRDALAPSTRPSPLAPPALAEAVRRLWNSSPDIQAARAELEAARARARAAAQPLYNPSLALDAENADVDRRTTGISLPLDLGRKRRARADQGQAELRASEAAYDVQRRDLAARWLKAWAVAALAGRQSGLGQRRVALMRRFDALAAERLKVGDIGSPERDLAALALGEAQVQQATLQSQAAAAQAALLAIEGRVAPAPPPLPSGLPPAIDVITPRATGDLPDMVQARSELASAEAGVQVARRARVPDPTISFTGGQVRSGPRTDRVIGMSVSIPLPVLNNGRAEVDAAIADVDAAAARLQSRRQSLDARLAGFSERYRALRHADEAFRGSRAAAFEDRVALLEKLWRAGEIGTSDYLVQLKQSLDTALSGLELEGQAWQAWFDYLTAAGRLNDWLAGRTQDANR